MPAVFVIMDVQTSGQREPKPPTGITELSDSVWVLHSPGQIDVEIIFFHGLQLDGFEDAFWKTFLATKVDEDGNELVWPQKWLPERLPYARVLSVSYDSSADGRAADDDDMMYSLGENLVNDIMLDTVNNIGQNCPVFLVGHSLGGIVIKQLILSAIKQRDLYKCGGIYQPNIERISTFLENFKGVFYYATPHGGSELADFFNQVPNKSAYVGLLKTLDTKRQRINDSFRIQQENMNIRSLAVGEGLAMPGVGIVVGEASARQDVEEFHISKQANHITVCKARRRDDPAVIGRLINFILGPRPDGQITYRPHGANAQDSLL